MKRVCALCLAFLMCLSVLPMHVSAGSSLAAPSSLAVANTTSGVKVSWGKVTGATKYRVYYKGGTVTSWAKAGDTASTSYTVTGLKSGTKYTFTVKCISPSTSAYNTTGKSITYIAAPSSIKAANTTSGIKISWGKVTGAAKYRVFYKKGSATSWTKLTDTTSTSYTYTSAAAGTKYTFTVRCVNSAGTSYTSAYNTTGTSITRLTAPSSIKTANTTSGVKVSWGKVTGATKYTVYYKGGSVTSWKSAGSTTSTSYTVTGLTSGTKYTFTVKCVSPSVSAYNTTGTSITYLAAPSSIKAANASSGVKVSWGKVTGATKYTVYYKGGSVTSWKSAGSTTSTSYTVTGLTSGTKYTFTVKCVSPSVSAYNTTGTSTIYLSVPKLGSVSNVSSGVKVTWSKVTGAASYAVYRKTGSGSWTKIATSTSTSYTDETVTSDTTYTYTVRAVKDSYMSSYDSTGLTLTYVHEHQYEVTSHKDATCTADGLDVETCSVCGDVQEEVISATGHTAGDWTTDKEATCTETGEKSQKCTVCGETIATEIIAAAGHQFGDWIVDTEATEETTGSRHKVCSVCGETTTEEIPVIVPCSHEYAEEVTKEATCTETGEKTYTCANCGDTYTEAIPVIDHTLGEWEVETEATEDAEGLKVQKCTVCGETINTEVIEKLAHTHSYELTDSKDATCEEDGYQTYTCKCGETYTNTIAAGHSYEETAKTEATCGQAGSVTYTCSKCEDTYTEEIPALTHEYTSQVIEPTCEADGYTVYTCTNCGDSYTDDVVEATGHVEGEWEVTKEAKAKVGGEGERALKCSVCGTVLETEVIETPDEDADGNKKYYIDLGDGETTYVYGKMITQAQKEEILGYINELRQSVADGKAKDENGDKGVLEPGQLTLATDSRLEAMGTQRAAEITYLFSHTSPNGTHYYDELWNEGIEASGLGENITKFTGAAKLEQNGTLEEMAYYNWYSSTKGHYENMVKTKWTEIEIYGIVTTANTAYFGTIFIAE